MQQIKMDEKRDGRMDALVNNSRVISSSLLVEMINKVSQ